MPRTVLADDLFTLVAGKPDWFSADGVHLNAKGSAAMGEQDADQIRKMLADKSE